MFPENEQPNGNCTGNWLRTRRSFISVMNVMPANACILPRHAWAVYMHIFPFPTRCELIFPCDTGNLNCWFFLLSAIYCPEHCFIVHCRPQLLVGPVQWQMIGFILSFAGAITPFHPLVQCTECRQFASYMLAFQRENSFVILFSVARNLPFLYALML